MKWAIKTDVGAVREENQDYAGVFTKGSVVFAILCDGLGGHSGGKIASTITVKQFEKQFHKTSISEDMDFYAFLEKGVISAKKQMVKRASKEQSLLDMGTTLTAALIFEKFAIIYNIGDSRTYYYNGLFHQITNDQNLKNYYMAEQSLSEEEAENVWGAAALTSALGPNKSTKADVFRIDIDKECKFLLTSDGIHDFIQKPRIEQILNDETLDIEQKTRKLIDEALTNSSSDNLTAILVEGAND